jgi:hypothetical protein
MMPGLFRLGLNGSTPPLNGDPESNKFTGLRRFLFRFGSVYPHRLVRRRIAAEITWDSQLAHLSRRTSGELFFTITGNEGMHARRYMGGTTSPAPGLLLIP